ncbi:unnamed protein product [Rotaria sp. Silwood1]|nr:unnamed protein product [Rotaria sp. Silwood1]CAF0958442.1 unnamed protein product [Rotaria sp. Silwood1]CAF3370590.1 unnamed protein product [Rotaria sp. Silwood1]CAF4568198.1 unnamed protein product [Rotaria sp. Silwood1]CAF4574074.1 unnamed protein product [Rotaria sp. Silwood1]
MVIDIRRLSNGTGPVRSVYQHGHFCVRAFHLFLTYPIYSCFLLVIIYLEIMDTILYFQIRSRGPLDLNTATINHTNFDKFHQTITEALNDTHMFNALSIKKIMVGPITQYVRAPLAEYVESNLHFTYYFPLISANAISIFHCCLSLISIKFFSSESLYQRRIGVLIFEIRTFLDDLDGVVFRAHAKNSHYKSYHGGLGFYVDALSDVLGGTCLMIGCLLYFYKQRPIRSITHQISRSLSTRLSRSSDTENEETDVIILNMDDEPKIPSVNDINTNILETKGRIFISLSLFTLRYSLAAIFWDRDVQAYESLLDSYKDKSQQQALQLAILHSPLTILIFYLWRYLCALSIQDYLVIAIFFDRTWTIIEMENNDLTYWKNYQTAMQWIQGNTINNAPILMREEEENTMIDDDNDKQLQFTIDDDLLDFYRLSRDHKANRKNQKSQEKNEAEQFELIPGEQMRPNVQSISKLPPVNRSKLRQLELEWLYGSTNSSKIHARETQIQMEFDQIFDKRQPSYFPSLPNRLQLDPDSYKQRSSFPTVTISDATS